MAERCFIMLKPGVLNRRLAGEVISRLERKGLNLVAAKLMRISPELAKNHYKEHEDKCFYSNLVDYISSAPVLAMVWEADNCVALVRRLVGATDGSNTPSVKVPVLSNTAVSVLAIASR